MGGNALNTPTKRIDKQEYLQVSQLLVGDFQQFGRVQPLHTYRNKQSFGDIDLVLERNPVMVSGKPQFEHQDLIEFVSRYNNRDIFCNHSMVSFDYRNNQQEGIQVDLILASTEDFGATHSFMSYNDLGIIIKQLASHMHMSFGQQGLIYHLKDNNNDIASICVSKDIREILVTLGYDPAPFFAGFDDVVDIYHYGASSVYFDHQRTLNDTPNSKMRQTIKKRHIYQGFLDYVAQQPFKQSQSLSKTDIRDKLFEQYPQFFERHQRALEQHKQTQHFRTLYNGHLITQWTGLSNNNLGQFMTHMKERHGDDYMRMITSQPNIKSYVQECFHQYKTPHKKSRP